MAIPVFPSLAGLSWPEKRKPIWSTILQRSSSGKNTAIKLYTFPRYTWTLKVELLRQYLPYTEFAAVMGFVNSVAGQGDVFYFTDPDDNSVTNQPNGLGDGVTTQFQLERALGGFSEPIQSLNGTPTIRINGTPTAAFTLDSTGIVTFSSPPALNAAIDWSGSYYWLCRLDADDQVEFSKFASGRFEVDQISFSLEKQ